MSHTTFGDFPPKYQKKENSKIVIIPVPYDRTSTWIKGADKGPAAILEASHALENYDIETNSEAYRQGIFTDSPVLQPSSLEEKVRQKLHPIPPSEMVKLVKRRVKMNIKGCKFPVVIGGEHSVSIGAIQAHAAYCSDMSVLQLDAHSDLRDSYHGSKYNHACVMARAQELCTIVQAGIRSMDVSELQQMDVSKVFFAEDMHNNEKYIPKIVNKLSEKVYLTIDLDVFDPSIMPSTGTPEPGGLEWYYVLELMRNVFRERNVVGFDIVELCPNKNNKAPDFLAAKLIYKLLSYKFCLK
jgi:agmatinase